MIIGDFDFSFYGFPDYVDGERPPKAIERARRRKIRHMPKPRKRRTF
jgi:hypothetical protein